ncbi:uncharacterized protein [Physcomitrium patens]|uniref:Uncharacterized protein n=2 Tax=Physcomitrium patens TaxID=3218 RepID=A0A7I4E4E9_PHYPA|nr:uncharacterized protein LOC112283822 isoform X1 [Physcomitrium patens]|eukprot:XP_024378810.1 uncharacterized protein LOC112283822 isoform X1 [Physcomitrella patens]
MATVYGRIDTGSELSPRSRKRRIYVGNEGVDRTKQESVYAEAMGIPLLERLHQLEQHMAVLEQDYNPKGLAVDLRSPTSPSSIFSSPSTPSSLERRCRPAKTVLLEAEAKGTLVERIQRLEIRIGQHSMYLEKAFSSRRLSSSQFGAKCTECDHREDSENMRLSLYKNYCSQLQENENPQDVSTNDKKLKVPPVENSPSKENDTEELRGVTEDLATGELFQGPEDITSTLPTVKARTEAACLRDKVINESSEAEAAGKRMHDENGLATDLESTKNTSKSVEMTHIDVHNDNRTNEEQPVRAKHTAELVQNVYSRKEDGALSKSLIHFRSVDNTSDMFESVKSLRNEKTNERLNEVYPELALVPAPLPEYATQVSPSMKNEMRRKHSFKHIRERINASLVTKKHQQ